MEEKIIEIIENLTDYKDMKCNKDIDLLENEILDSLAFIELIEMLNDEFNIEIQPTQVSPDTWRSVKNIAEYIPTMCQDIIDIAEMYKKLVTEYLTSDEWVDQAINIASTANDTSESLKGTSIRLVTDVKGMMDSIETDNRRLKSTMEDKRNQLDGILNTLTAINPGKVTPPTKSDRMLTTQYINNQKPLTIQATGQVLCLTE